MAYLDVIRVAGISLVILLHTVLGSPYLFSEIGSTTWYVALTYYAVSRISVPLFVMASAVAVILLPLERGTPPTPANSIHRIGQLLIPLALWTIIYSWYYQTPPAELINAWWKPVGLPHLWFLYMLFGLYLLAPIAGELFQSRPALVDYATLLWLLFSGVGTPLAQFFGADPASTVGLFYGYVPGILGYALLGLSLTRRQAPSSWIAGALLLSGISGLVLVTALDGLHFAALNQPFRDRAMDYRSIFVVMASAGAFCLARKIKRPSSPLLTHISGLVIGVYFFHELVLDVARRQFKLLGPEGQSWWFLPTLAAITIALSAAAAEVLRRVQRRLPLRVFF